MPWEGAGTHSSAWPFCSPSLCPQTVCWGNQGPPLHIPTLPGQGRAGTAAGIRGTSPSNATLGVARCASGSGAVPGGSPGPCPAQPGQGRPSLPACMYFSSCSRRCSTSAGVSVKIFFGGKAGTTLAPYSFLSWDGNRVSAGGSERRRLP